MLEVEIVYGNVNVNVSEKRNLEAEKTGIGHHAQREVNDPKGEKEVMQLWQESSMLGNGIAINFSKGQGHVLHGIAHVKKLSGDLMKNLRKMKSKRKKRRSENEAGNGKRRKVGNTH